MINFCTIYSQVPTMITYPTKVELFELVSNAFGLFTIFAFLFLIFYVDMFVLIILLVSLGIYVLTLAIRLALTSPLAQKMPGQGYP